MCTVTYIPQPGGHFILTSNRDENAARSPQRITRSKEKGMELIFPRDTVAGGTWIAASEDDRVTCLLNGAFEKHEHRPPYRHSRGVMVMDFYTYPDASAFFEKYDFDGIEPFTLVVVDKGLLYELRWDLRQTHVRQLEPSGKYLWSSATLYPGEIGEMRQQWFKDWLHGREDFSLEAIQQFHRTGGNGDPWNGFIMNRNDRVQTVSITNIVKGATSIELIYNNLLTGKTTSDQVDYTLERT